MSFTAVIRRVQVQHMKYLCLREQLAIVKQISLRHLQRTYGSSGPILRETADAIILVRVHYEHSSRKLNPPGLNPCKSLRHIYWSIYLTLWEAIQ